MDERRASIYIILTNGKINRHPEGLWHNELLVFYEMNAVFPLS